ncbi:MAG TPA: AraC family transcriptional regulator [Chitinophagaceae bacterium]|nr:AraC family transcriptional regulator [Chitinophagaceae bacterium]
MPVDIPYYDSIPESFQNSSMPLVNPDFEMLRYEDIPEKNLHGRPPFRLNAFVIGYVTGGSALLTINSKDYRLNAGTIYFSTPWHIRKYSDIIHWRGHMLFFTQQFLYQYIMGSSFVNEFPYFQSENGVVAPLSTDESSETESLILEMHNLFKSGREDRFKILFHYLNILLLKCKSLKSIEKFKPIAGSENIVILFQEKLNNYFVALNRNQAQEPLSLTNIAQQLHLHPIYLSNLVKAKCGKTVSQLIRQRIVLEAKALLRNSNMTVSEVAYYLRFTDTSNFAKFFKSLTGTSPSDFRSSSAIS